MMGMIAGDLSYKWRRMNEKRMCKWGRELGMKITKLFLK